MRTNSFRAKSYTDKYTVVADFVQDETGTMLDIGSRDKILSRYLNLETIAYSSADRDGDHDYHVDLEQPLPEEIPSFDFVVALDVLEHIDDFHAAFTRVTTLAKRQVIIALPCLGNIYRRLRFLFHGDLGTGKYRLTADVPPDRHRWLTLYPEIQATIPALAEAAGFTVTDCVREVEAVRSCRWLSRLPMRFVSWNLVTGRLIYRLTRVDSISNSGS